MYKFIVISVASILVSGCVHSPITKIAKNYFIHNGDRTNIEAVYAKRDNKRKEIRIFFSPYVLTDDEALYFQNMMYEHILQKRSRDFHEISGKDLPYKFMAIRITEMSDGTVLCTFDFKKSGTFQRSLQYRIDDVFDKVKVFELTISQREVKLRSKGIVRQEYKGKREVFEWDIDIESPLVQI